MEKPSINPVNLVSRGSEPTIIVLAAIGLVAFLLIMTVMLILLRRKAKKAGISVYKR